MSDTPRRSIAQKLARAIRPNFKLKGRKTKRFFRRIEAFIALSTDEQEKHLIGEDAIDACPTQLQRIVVSLDQTPSNAEIPKSIDNIQPEDILKHNDVQAVEQDLMKFEASKISEDEFIESLNNEELSSLFCSAVNVISDRASRIGEKGLMRTRRLADLFTIVHHVEPIACPLTQN